MKPEEERRANIFLVVVAVLGLSFLAYRAWAPPTIYKACPVCGNEWINAVELTGKGSKSGQWCYKCGWAGHKK